jgi:hypothetical protein
MVIEANVAQLEAAGEVGRFLAPYYQTALDIAPMLGEVAIQPWSTEEAKRTGTIGKATTERNAQTGLFEVFVNSAGGWDFYRWVMADRPLSVSMTAEELGKTPEEMTPQIIAAHVLAHELGHANDWLETGYNRVHHIIAINSLPIPVSPDELRAAVANDRPYWERYFERYLKDDFASHRLGSIDEFLDFQSRAYRALPMEARANRFAAEVICRTVALGEPTAGF